MIWQRQPENGAWVAGTQEDGIGITEDGGQYFFTVIVGGDFKTFGSGPFETLEDAQEEAKIVFTSFQTQETISLKGKAQC